MQCTHYVDCHLHVPLCVPAVGSYTLLQLVANLLAVATSFYNCADNALMYFCLNSMSNLNAFGLSILATNLLFHRYEGGREGEGGRDVQLADYFPLYGSVYNCN